jgi:hypothetical protein
MDHHVQDGVHASHLWCPSLHLLKTVPQGMKFMMLSHGGQQLVVFRRFILTRFSTGLP